VEWLVRYHLLFGWRRNAIISDPRTCGLCQAVQTVKSGLICCVCSPSAISGAWDRTRGNNGKAVLDPWWDCLPPDQAALETRTRRPDIREKPLAQELKRRCVPRARPLDHRKDIQAETARHYPPYWQGASYSIRRSCSRNSCATFRMVKSYRPATLMTTADATRAALSMATTGSTACRRGPCRRQCRRLPAATPPKTAG